MNKKKNDIETNCLKRVFSFRAFNTKCSRPLKFEKKQSQSSKEKTPVKTRDFSTNTVVFTYIYIYKIY